MVFDILFVRENNLLKKGLFMDKGRFWDRMSETASQIQKVSQKLIDAKLFEANTAEETKQALDLGANVNAQWASTWGDAPYWYDPKKYEYRREGVETALLHAKTAEQKKLLIEAGADVNVKDEKGNTALMKAIASKETEIVRLLIKFGADLNIKDEEGYTALLKAVKLKETEIIRLLIEAGADIEAKNRYGETALMLAVYSKETEIVRLLIKLGADVNAKDRYGKTALMRVIDDERFEQTEIMQLLIKAGADVNAKGENGKTALMYAKTAEQTKLLIKAGADVNAKDEKGQTALMHASYNVHMVNLGQGIRKGEVKTEQTKLLIKAGADVNAKDEKGQTALMVAATAGQTNLLIKVGADVNAENRYGNTALMEGNQEQIKLLIEAGAKYHKQNLSEHVLKKVELVEEQRAEKARDLKERLRAKPRKKIPSGVVFADAIAEMKRSGKIKGDITPKRAKGIITKMVRERILSERNGKK